MFQVGYASCKRYCGARSCCSATVCKATRRLPRDTRTPNPNSTDVASSTIGETHAIISLTAEPSCKDEARIGQKNGQTRMWAKKGTRPRQPADQRYQNAYLFGAICPRRGTGAALMLPWSNTEAMQLHLNEISCNVAAQAHAVVLTDRAGWHTTDKLHVPDMQHLLLVHGRKRSPPSRLRTSSSESLSLPSRIPIPPVKQPSAPLREPL